MKAKKKYSLYVSKNDFLKHANLLLIEEKYKKNYVHIKDFNTYMYDHNLHHGRKRICCYCLQALSTGQISKCNINDGFKINSRQMIQMPKEGEYIKFKKFERKVNSPFIIYADSESILVPEDNGKQKILYTQISKECCLQLWL